MPSNKPRIQALVEQDVYEKFKKICDTEKRTESNLGGMIITEYVENIDKIKYNQLLYNNLEITFERIVRECEENPFKTYAADEIIAIFIGIKDCL